jgi:hypothetical protein
MKNIKEHLPNDIEDKINQLFLNLSENQKIKDLLHSLWSTSLNVGPDQLARSILVLSEGNLNKVQEIFMQDFFCDPRDVIMMAESKLGNPRHYFIPTFDEIHSLQQNP